MPRRYINELTQQESIDEVFVANDKQLRPNRAGNLYLQVELSDRSGSITARIWNANDAIYRSFDNGDYLRVTGTAQLFQGAMQIIATKLHRSIRPKWTRPISRRCRPSRSTSSCSAWAKSFAPSATPPCKRWPSAS